MKKGELVDQLKISGYTKESCKGKKKNELVDLLMVDKIMESNNKTVVV